MKRDAQRATRGRFPPFRKAGSIPSLSFAAANYEGAQCRLIHRQGSQYSQPPSQFPQIRAIHPISFLETPSAVERDASKSACPAPGTTQTGVC